MSPNVTDELAPPNVKQERARNLKCVGAVAKIDDELIVRHVDLDAAVEHARHRHVFHPQCPAVAAVLRAAASAVVGRLTAAAVTARHARRAVPRGGAQQRQQSSVVTGEVPDVGHQQRVVDRFRRHVDAPPVAVAQRRQQRGVVSRGVGITDRRDVRHVAATQTAARVDARQRPKTVEVELAEIRHEAMRRPRGHVVAARPKTRPPSFGREVVFRPVVISKHVGRADVGRVVNRSWRRDRAA